MARAGVAQSQAVFGPSGEAPDAIIVSGPDFYKSHITSLYGGYKRTRNLYGKATYQKDPDDARSGNYEAYIYWSAAEGRWCVGKHLGATLGDASADTQAVVPVPMYQNGEGDSMYPRFNGAWLLNLYGSGFRFQADHLVKLEPLHLPDEAADPARRLGGYMHVSQRRFVDYELPPKPSSLVGDPAPLQIGEPQRVRPEMVTWMAASTITGRTSGPLLDPPSVDEPPHDWLGNLPTTRCGIAAVLAAVHEYPGHIASLFGKRPLVNPMGSYHVWLYDPWHRQWNRLIVDDYVPVVPAQVVAPVHVDPLTGYVRVLQMEAEHDQPVPWGGGARGTLWAFLLEKALAKLCGSFEAVHRSHPAALLMALTGADRDSGAGVNGAIRWARDGAWWSRHRFLEPDRKAIEPSPTVGFGGIRDTPDPNVARRVVMAQPLRCSTERVAGTWHQCDEFFAVVKELNQINSLLFAYTDLGSDVGGQQSLPRGCPLGTGLVHGAGYSILSFVEDEDDHVQLVQLRNLWHPLHCWRGAWSDGSDEWNRYPNVRRHHLRSDQQGSGRFWMSWQDFCQTFDRIEVLPMPQATRKASHVNAGRTASLAKNVARMRGVSKKTDGGLSELFQWRCCAVELAR